MDLTACRTFDDTVNRRMYVTGAMGRQSDERFTEPYALDNRTSIGEGCQSAMLIRVAQRLLLLDADATYADVIERVMYNNLAANVGRALKILTDRNFLHRGDTVVVVTEIRIREKLIDTIQVETVD